MAASFDHDGLDDGELLEEADIYKATTSSDLVVLRHLKLFRSKFVTFHDYNRDPTDKKSWFLDRKCELQPRSAADIREPQTKTIRPPGTWTLTAMIKSKGQPVQLVSPPHPKKVSCVYLHASTRIGRSRFTFLCVRTIWPGHGSTTAACGLLMLHTHLAVKN